MEEKYNPRPITVPEAPMDDCLTISTRSETFRVDIGTDSLTANLLRFVIFEIRIEVQYHASCGRLPRGAIRAY